MPRAYCVYKADEDMPTVFYACEIDKLCKFIGCTIKNLKQRMASKRKSQFIGNGYTVMQEDVNGVFQTMIG